MKRMLCSGAVDCTKCRFGANGDESCPDGRDIKKKEMQGCSKGVSIRKTDASPVQTYKQQMMMAGLAGRNTSV